MKRISLFVFILFLGTHLLVASKGKLISSIPFEMVGSYVVVKVRINNSSPLSMILDTGLRSTIISDLMPGDSVSLENSELRELQGLGDGQPLKAYVSFNNVIKSGKIKLEKRPVYLLEDDIFGFSRQTGQKINGLLGIDFFQDYIVQIDYTAGRIRFYEKKLNFAPKGYDMMPMTVEGRKMYIHLSVLETDSARRKIKMLIDTGAQLTAWFHNLKPESVRIPEKMIRGRIGQGISGEITGIYARVPQICIANFCVRNPIVVFPDSAAIADIISTSDRDGTIGSLLLSRFNLFIDYPNQKFYFKPNGNFKKPFAYNVAGIEITQAIAFVPQTEVWKVWEGSPADVAGVKPGDQIVEINGRKVFQLPIGEQKKLFETPSKRQMSLVLNRNGEEIFLKLDMQSKI